MVRADAVSTDMRSIIQEHWMVRSCIFDSGQGGGEERVRVAPQCDTPGYGKAKRNVVVSLVLPPTISVVLKAHHDS